jgi:hypothetical protein
MEMEREREMEGPRRLVFRSILRLHLSVPSV